ncbi:protein phosphatase 2C domain-containing protein [Leptolyngbya sp. FACHB-541]|uniref:PP2C family protein-serine/threonine phosphatase n=1 Tax=Leptolyngbya sp. FACHB-541 TaxID=2692810 RepID=UPI001682BCDE|nr:protein phosphatase 2C domain-containing protein [Leptolyngbya sp. FACHB-541]MBD1995475.1 protein phosphatase 2C domain-containing protein [Leptolyngbya sp. FACHB-541]
MSRPHSSIECPNPECLHSNNSLGSRICDRCQTPLLYNYLWAVGAVDHIPTGTRINGRYGVVAPRIWLDTQPGRSPDVPSSLPDAALPYLHLYPQRLYVPGVFGFCALKGGDVAMLLENAPIDLTGKLYPAIATVWSRGTAVRQVYWLWQILQLWTPLQEMGVAASLLTPDNLRIEGWRVRLRELYSDEPEIDQLDTTEPEVGESNTSELETAEPNDGRLESTTEETASPRSLKELADVWLTWIDGSQEALIQPLRKICQRMQSATSKEAEGAMQSSSPFGAIATQLNQLLLEQAAQQPLQLSIAGATSTGPKRTHNEDACYPITLNSAEPPQFSELLPHLAIVCDGIGGHAGGEVASQLALRSLQLQFRALLAEIAEQPELMTPEVVTQQIEAIIRVVNNLIAAQNDTQGRELRQRMGTTLVMALQLPQKIETPTGASNTHELYLAHLGDSRAYWLTPRYCHTLTVDDDVATREVRMGRSLYRDALKRPDAGALTQALGTRDGEFLHPVVQRFVLEEDGVLLLCSDGLSDHNRVEQSWEPLTRQLFKGELTLDEAVQAWIEVASEKNGHDNISVVLLQCQVSPQYPQPLEPKLPPAPLVSQSELSESSRALLYGDEEEFESETTDFATRSRQKASPLAIAFGLAVLMFLLGVAGVAAWRQINPESFNRTWERLLQPSSQSSP